jgi:hypothetical protein
MKDISHKICKIIGASYVQFIHPPPWLQDPVKRPGKVYKDYKQDYITFRLIKVKGNNRRKYDK